MKDNFAYELGSSDSYSFRVIITQWSIKCTFLETVSAKCPVEMGFALIIGKMVLS